MFGHKTFHHVHPVADSNASPWQVFRSRLCRGFSWGGGARALVIGNRMDYAESASEQVCHGRADESDYILRSPDRDPCYSEFSCQGKEVPRLV